MKTFFSTLLLFITSIAFTQIDNKIEKTIIQADILNNQNQLKKALFLIEDLLANNVINSASCLSKGNLYHKAGVYAYYLEEDTNALNYWKKAIIIRESCPETISKELVLTYGNLSDLYDIMGNTKQQIRYSNKCINLLEKSHPIDTLGLAYRYTEMGDWYTKIGDYSLATESLSHAQRYYKTQKNVDKKDMARLYRYSSNLFLAKKNYNDAIKISLTALDIYTELRDTFYIAGMLQNLGNAYSNLDEYQLAANYFKKAIAINLSQKERTILGDNYEGLSVVYKNWNKPDSALFYINQAFLFRQKDKNSITGLVRLAGNFENKGDIFFKAKDYEKALNNYDKAIEILVPTIANNNVLHFSNIHVISRKDLIRVLILKMKALQQRNQPNDLALVLKNFNSIDTLFAQTRQSLQSLESKFTFQKNIKSTYGNAIQLALQLYEESGDKTFKEIAYHFCTKNKAIILIEGLQDEDAQFKGLPSEALAEENGINQEIQKLETLLAELNLQITPPVDSLQILQNRLVEMGRKKRSLVLQLEEKYPRYHELKYKSQTPETVEAIQKKLDSDRAIIEYFLGDTTIYIFVITKNSLTHYTIAKPNNFDDLCQDFRKESLYNEVLKGTQYTSKANLLYKLLLEQPLRDLPTSIKRIAFIPDEVLQLLSFQALPYEEIKELEILNIPYLFKRYAISRAYSNRLLFDRELDKQLQKSQKTFGGFALDYKDYNFKQLTAKSGLDSLKLKERGMGILNYSIEEIEEVVNLYEEGDAEIFINQSASLQNFIEQAPNFKVVHLSMHAFADEDNPWNSGLIFHQNQENNILRAREIYAQKIPAELVILSACNTGGGTLSKGEGIRSLARSFAYAGSPSILASLWSANDFSTKDITIPLHKFLKQGLPKDIALQKATLTYFDNISNDEKKSPYYWAHLIMIGDIEPVFNKPNYGLWMLGFSAMLLILFFLRRFFS